MDPFRYLEATERTIDFLDTVLERASVRHAEVVARVDAGYLQRGSRLEPAFRDAPSPDDRRDDPHNSLQTNPQHYFENRHQNDSSCLENAGD